MRGALVCSKCGRRFAEPASRCSADGTFLCGAEALERVGRHLGNYEILAIEGVGGMGVVYKARHAILGKPVAIKVLHERFAMRDGAADHFLAEARAVSRIRHPNVVDVTDFGIAPGGAAYFVMEYLEGVSLDSVLARDGTVPLFNAVNVVNQIARALAAAHDEEIVHCDLKPENVYLIRREGRRRIVRLAREGEARRFVVEKEGPFDFVKLLDFGIARVSAEDRGPSVGIRSGLIFGTPCYMSPEQVLNRRVDARSDVYSLGVIFYEMVTGAVPFDGITAQEIMTGHVSGEVIAPKRRNPEVQVDEGTNATIMRCLEKDPARRFQTMSELSAALTNCFVDTVFLRNARLLPGALEAGIDAPPPPQARAENDEARRRRLTTPGIGDPGTERKP